jgi:hypothetical protein
MNLLNGAGLFRGTILAALCAVIAGLLFGLRAVNRRIH